MSYDDPEAWEGLSAHRTEDGSWVCEKHSAVMVPFEEHEEMFDTDLTLFCPAPGCPNHVHSELMEDDE